MSLFPRSQSPTWRARAGSSADLAVQRFRVEVVNGPNAGASADAGGELAIGTAPGNDLVVTDATVSRYHCEIAATVDGFLVTDLGSANGTLLAGYRIQTGFLEDGALLDLGETRLRFAALDEHASPVLPAVERFGDVPGASPAMRQVFAQLEVAAPSATPILLEGESGAGKSRLAAAIHARSGRGGPFVVVDCAALVGPALESELFGHERGAFPGARDGRVGAFEAAHGGTLLLDGVSALPLELQPKLLRALESGTVRRMGSVTPQPVDVRVIAASDVDLRVEVNRGGFRSDLLRHLAAVRVLVPALRERREDLPELLAAMYREATGGAGAPPVELTARLLRQRYPGNLRELRGAVVQALGEDAPRTSPAAPAFDFSLSFREAKEQALAEWTSVYVSALLARFEGNLSRAARTVNMDRNHLRDLLRKYVQG